MLNRAFLTDYWRKVRWILLLAGLILVTTLFYPMQWMAQEQVNRGPMILDPTGSVDWLSLHLTRFDPDAWLMLNLALLSVVLFLDDRRSATGDLMYSLPVTRQSLFLTKWIAGAGVIGGVFLTFFGVTSIYYRLYSAWTASPYWVIPQFSLVAGLAHLAIFSLMLLVQTLIGNAMIAGVFSLLFLGINIVTTLVVNSIWFNTGLDYGHPLISLLVRLKYFHLSDLYLPSLAGTNGGGMALYYENWWISVFVLAASIWMVYRLGSFAYSHNRAEKNGQLLVFTQLIPVVKWGCALILGLGISYWIARPALGRNVLQFDLLFLIGWALSYMILSRVLRLLRADA